NNHWPVQLYVRESRRMRSDYVVTEHDCQRRVITDKGIALGSYAMDSHNTQYFVNKDGFANTEGGYFWRLDKAYPIDYRAIIPKKGECSNLLVTVCVSVTHAAYGSIRQEPCYMMIGHAAGAAASLAIDKRVSVQDVDYNLLKDKLLKEGQMLVDLDDSKFSGNQREGN
ncbi:MAG: FAD-dependent oxidoreductase, partial [Lentimicrobium sp.]|nr:FAD-dependent oxidoreductase [Lentimicrobium sp.]